jgi:hypothetical protein
MPATATTGSDTISLNNTNLTDLADGDAIAITFPNEIMTVKVGKNQNTIYASNSQGNVTMLKLRVILGGSTDQFLNGLWALQQSNPSAFPLMVGEYNKPIGVGNGQIVNVAYPLQGGVFTKNPEAFDNVEGDVKTAIVEWEMKFALARRALT